ncbi:hypothetical protein D1872_334470 [compost metagenome]
MSFEIAVSVVPSDLAQFVEDVLLFCCQLHVATAATERMMAPQMQALTAMHFRIMASLHRAT